MVDSIKTSLDRQHLHVNDNSGHDTFPRNNTDHVYMLTIQKHSTAYTQRTVLIFFNSVITFSKNGNTYDCNTII